MAARSLPTVAQGGGRSLYQWGDLCWRYLPAPDVLMTGYGNRSAADLYTALVHRANLLRPVVVDIRFHAHSEREEWCQAALRERFGAAYVPVPALGNRAHHRERGAASPEAPHGAPPPLIEIADLAAGVAAVRAVIERGRTPVLLCGCGTTAGCHRAVVAAHLTERCGLTTFDFDLWPERRREAHPPPAPTPSPAAAAAVITTARNVAPADPADPSQGAIPSEPAAIAAAPPAELALF